MATWHRNAPQDSPSIEIEESEVPAYLEHLAEQERRGIPGIFPWPDTIPLRIVDGDDED